jgi:hypothetical protein
MPLHVNVMACQQAPPTRAGANAAPPWSRPGILIAIYRRMVILQHLITDRFFTVSQYVEFFHCSLPKVNPNKIK